MDPETKYFENNVLNTNQEPHIVRGKIDMYAFNALAVQELIIAFHAGNKKIWVPADDYSLIIDSAPGKKLMELGWTFLIMKE